MGRSSAWAPDALGSANAASRQSWALDHYRLLFEAHRMYGRDPDRLDAARLANVKHWCRCAQIIEKYTASGLDGLSDDECQVLAAALPKRFSHLEELPGYAEILRGCRRRLGAPN